MTATGHDHIHTGAGVEAHGVSAACRLSRFDDYIYSLDGALSAKLCAATTRTIARGLDWVVLGGMVRCGKWIQAADPGACAPGAPLDAQ